MSDNVQLQLEQEEEEEEEWVEKVCKNVPGRLHGRPTDWCSSRQGGPARPVRRTGGRLCGQRGGPSCKIRHPPSLSLSLLIQGTSCRPASRLSCSHFSPLLSSEPRLLMSDPLCELVSAREHRSQSHKVKGFENFAHSVKIIISLRTRVWGIQ